MYFLLVCLVAVCCSRSDAATSTRINYLPNGQVGGYQLIINNTVEPRVNNPLPRDRVSKIVKQTSSIGNTFTTVDEQVDGDNSYLNVHRVLKQNQARMKYPLKNVLMVPGVRNKNGVVENVKLRFAQIGPYAALIVPVDKSERDSLANVEFKDSVKTYVEIQEPTPEATQETSDVYAPPAFTESPTVDVNSLQNLEGNSPPASNKNDQSYKYPPATNDFSDSSKSPGKGASTKSEPGFVLRVVNPTKGSQDSAQEFFVPANPNQFAPERDDKIIANPFKYSGFSDNPTSSQFKEVYNKDDPTASEFSAAQKDPLFSSKTKDDSAVGFNDAPAGDGTKTDYFGSHVESSQQFETSWSLFETKDQFGRPIVAPPSGQPEFSDVALSSSSEGSAHGSDHQSQNVDRNSGSNSAIERQEQTSLSASASTSTELDSRRFQGLKQGQSKPGGSIESTDEARQNDYNFDQSNHQDKKSESVAEADHFQEKDSFSEVFPAPKEERVASVSKVNFDKSSGGSSEQTVKSDQDISAIQGTTSNHPGKDSHSVSSVSDQQFDRFAGNSAHSNGELYKPFGTIQNAPVQDEAQSSTFHTSPTSTHHQSDIASHGASDADASGETVNEHLDHQLGKFQSVSVQSNEQVTNADSTSAVSAVNGQINRFQEQNIELPRDDPNLKLERFQPIGRQNFENIAKSASAATVNDQSDRFQALFTPNVGQIGTSSAASAAYSNLHGLGRTAHPTLTPLAVSADVNSAKILSDERFKNLIQDPSLNTQLDFVSPDGQTAAVLTTAGNSAVIQPPSKVAHDGRSNGKIIIPEVTIHFPKTANSDKGGALENSGPVPLGGQIDGFEGLHIGQGLITSLQHAQDTSSRGGSVFKEQPLGNAFETTADHSGPVSLFDATSAAAAAAAAVAADNEHFLQFGNSAIGSKQALFEDAALLSTQNNHEVALDVPEPGTIPHGDISVPKYPIPGIIQAGIPTDLGARNSLVHEPHGIKLIELDNSRPVSMFETSTAVNRLNESKSLVEKLKESGNTEEGNHLYAQTLLNVHRSGSRGQSGNQQVEDGSSVSQLGALPLPISHSANVGVSEASAKSRHEIVLPKYLIPLPNKAGIPINLEPESVPEYRYASRFGQPTPTNSHPVTVVSPVGPHTEQLLETLNGIIALPRRHTEPNPT